MIGHTMPAAGMASMIRCALALADDVGDPQPEWEVALGRLGHAIAEHPEAFTEKPHHSMDWYYPVLGGALRGAAAEERITDRWSEFVVEGLGIRCVDDRPWVTGAETCELALTLQAIGDVDRATELLANRDHFREELLNDRRGRFFSAYMVKAKQKMKIQLNRDQIQRVVG